MSGTQERLEEETEKWLGRLEEKLEGLEAEHPQMENVEAYRDDARHFRQEGDMVRAFEAVVYAWGILETLERTGEI